MGKKAGRESKDTKKNDTRQEWERFREIPAAGPSCISKK